MATSSPFGSRGKRLRDRAAGPDPGRRNSTSVEFLGQGATVLAVAKRRRTRRPARGRRPPAQGREGRAPAGRERHQGAHHRRGARASSGHGDTTGPPSASIADEAGVDPALITHFFGTKQRLFSEVVELPFDPEALIASIVDGPIGERGRTAGPVRGEPAQGSELRSRVHRPDAGRDQRALAADLFRQRLTSGVFGPLARRLGMDRAELRAAITATQTIGLVMGRHIIKIDALIALTDDEIVDLIGPTLQRYLAEPL